MKQLKNGNQEGKTLSLLQNKSNASAEFGAQFSKASWAEWCGQLKNGY